MKKLWFILVLFVAGVCSVALAEYIPEMPSFPGGQGALTKYIYTNLRYPKAELEDGKEGTVVVQFTVDSIGELSDFKVIRSVTPNFDAEALRVAQLMPDWTPGRQNGKSVAVQYKLPIRFKLQEEPKEIRSLSGTERMQEVFPKDSTFEKPDKMPLFPGGNEGLRDYIIRNLRYPMRALKKGVEGTVVVQFTVTQTGKLTDIEVIRSVDLECDKEAWQLVKNMPDWTPGYQNGKPVYVRFKLPIQFKLTDNKKRK